MKKPVTLLLTNDDGIHARGILTLKEALKPIGTLCVVCPDQERSAASHALTLHKPLRVSKIYQAGEFLGYATNGTPADCVVLGVMEILKEKPAMVISGINRGANLGGDVTYSGTVSAAMEGTNFGIPSVAFSLALRTGKHFNTAAHFVKTLVPWFLKQKFIEQTFLNVNIPDVPLHEVRGIKATSLSKLAYIPSLEKRLDLRGRAYYWIGGQRPSLNSEARTDIAAVDRNCVSITPVHMDLTNYKLLRTLRQWKKLKIPC